MTHAAAILHLSHRALLGPGLARFSDLVESQVHGTALIIWGATSQKPTEVVVVPVVLVVVVVVVVLVIVVVVVRPTLRLSRPGPAGPGPHPREEGCGPDIRRACGSRSPPGSRGLPTPGWVSRRGGT